MDGAKRRQGVLITGCLLLATAFAVSIFAVGRGEDAAVRTADVAAPGEVEDAVAGLDIGQVIQNQEDSRSAAQLDTSMAEASLEALRQNGALPQEGTLASQSAVLGLVHSVSCLPASCDRIVEWAGANGFQASNPVLTLGHGGAEEFHVELRQALAAESGAMTASANLVADAVAGLATTDNTDQIEDLIYAGWAPELIDGGADQ